ncbi:penicillin-binding protein 1B [Colwellia sp. D2M02]|uniref:penicillin-binding protein 1B n=1 Tax=Colwellia sp. D2M02 TaxID=2841562 RepID=UPI001C07F50B|nr:penicillin-binding protein 1B [Colwellia sp. D2M02]MBU2893110.1 penicillin-binding protein 1B [Colwellia sp. D2M02]
MTDNKKTRAKKSKNTSEKKSAIKTNDGQAKGWLSWCLRTFFKVCIAAFFTLIIVLIYLDAKVKKTFEGERWQVPVQVYGKVDTLHVGDEANLSHIAQELKLKGYKKVAKVSAPGQFAQSSHRLIIFQRAFTFAQGFMGAEPLTIEVENNHITALYVQHNVVPSIQLEPQLIARLVPDNKEDRELIVLQQVPAQLIDTLLLIEDRDFYHHSGVSPLGILRALYANMRAGRTVQGGSTLTQQLVKNMFLTRDRTLTRKAQEALMALILEFRYSKDQLLEAYLNEVYLGQNFAHGVYGFGLASNFYFGKNIAQLTNHEIALLIAQVKGPSYYDPRRHPKRAKQRRDLILRLMLEQDMLSLAEFKYAVNAPLSVTNKRQSRKKKYPAYLQLVNQELNELVSEDLRKSGIKVFTGFSHRSQQLVEQTINTQLPLLEKKYQQKSLQAAMVVSDISTGEVRALAGDRVSGFAGFNRALDAKRQIGSLIKPAIYLAALERFEQYNLATLLDDKAITLSRETGQNKKSDTQGSHLWRPKNYDGKYRGQVPLITGLVNSLNIPTVNLGMALGLDNVADAIHLLGYQQDITMRPAMLLGSMTMSPVEINQLYLPIAANGQYKKNHAITHIMSNQGETLWTYNDLQEQRLSNYGAYLLNYALGQVTQIGSAKSLSWRLPNNSVAGKTGTSNDLRDSWFVGYDAKHLVTTWLGNDDNKPTGLTGSSGALPLFADFMKAQGISDRKEHMPDGVIMLPFEQKTGLAVNEQCEGTTLYPAVAAGVRISKNCLQPKVDKRSWFEKLFSTS